MTCAQRHRAQACLDRVSLADDIFVRHAFGNLRDVVREVSYSPQMAVYLSYLDSASFASSGNHPDENCAPGWRSNAVVDFERGAETIVLKRLCAALLRRCPRANAALLHWSLGTLAERDTHI